jgi:hypothetical protein
MTKSMVFFDWHADVRDPNIKWLQITALRDICDVSKEPKQKIIRLNPQQQKELLSMLQTKESI